MIMYKKLSIILLLCFVLLVSLILSGCRDSLSEPLLPPDSREEVVLPPPDLPPPLRTPPIISTSPDGNYQLEIDGWDNGNREARIVDLTTGEVEWFIDDELTSASMARIWSPSGRFAVIEIHWHYFIDFVIVDTNDFSSVRLSIKESFDLFSEYFPYEHAPFENFLRFDKWIDNSILQMRFVTITTTGAFHGTFHYDAINSRVSNFEYREGWGH